MEYSTQAAKAAGGGDVDPELCKLWKLLNRDAQTQNAEKKLKIARKLSKKGVEINSKDINLLEIKDDAIYDDISSTSNEEEQISESVAVVDDFEIKDHHSLHQSPHIKTQLINHHENQSR